MTQKDLTVRNVPEAVAKRRAESDSFIREYRRGQAHIEHPIGYRLSRLGIFDDEHVHAYFHLLGEPVPEPEIEVASIRRKTVITIEEHGLVYKAKPANFPNRLAWLYRRLWRTLTDHDDDVVDFHGELRPSPEDIARLGGPRAPERVLSQWQAALKAMKDA